MSSKEKVAVIGAGALGLMAIKEMRDAGFQVTGFESRPYVGGLWKDTDDSTISVHATTIFNTSKFMAAMSDYPFSEEADVYPTAAQIYDYLQGYADHFDLRKHVKVSHKVRTINRGNNDWEMQIEDLSAGKTAMYHFDRICVSTGQFFTPRYPELSGIKKFKGNVLHSIDFHGGEPFTGQNVLSIGMHATAQDVTNSLSTSAKHVYLSHRHGQLFLPRFTEEGKPFDTAMNMTMLMVRSWAEVNIPGLWSRFLDKALAKMSNKAYPDIPESWGLKPVPSLSIATPLMADTLYPLLKSGFAEPVPAVKEIIGPRTLQLTDGRVLKDIDTILYCTGYHFDIPKNLVPQSMGEDSYDPYPNGPQEPPYLYKNTFPMSADPAIRNTLAFLSQSGTPYPGFVQHELRAMAIAQIWKGYKDLPPRREMLDWYEKTTKKRAATIKRNSIQPGTTFYSALLPFPDLFPWSNSMAGSGIYENLGGMFNGLFNAKAWSLWWNDRELYDLCTKNYLSPTIFRVFDEGGRKALEREDVKRRLKRDNEVFDRAVQAKLKELEAQRAGKKDM